MMTNNLAAFKIRASDLNTDRLYTTFLSWYIHLIWCFIPEKVDNIEFLENLIYYSDLKWIIKLGNEFCLESII